jgi:hypothetical protein
MDLIKRQRRYAQKRDDPNTIQFCDAAIELLHDTLDILKTRKALGERLEPSAEPIKWPEPARANAAKLWGQIVPSSTKPPRQPIFL